MIDQSHATSSLELAKGFGWSADAIKHRVISRDSAILDVVRTTMSGQPAMTFATVVERNGVDPLEYAALYGYHAGTSWGVLADSDGLSVFNSHRLSNGKWLTLPRVLWDECESRNSIVQALGPYGLIEERIEPIAKGVTTVTGILQPIDDRLVERLDQWRDEAMRYTAKTKDVDEKLQTIYSQLFVLRAVEDRKLDPSLPTLESVVRNSDDINVSAWNRLFQQARARVGSDLFHTNYGKDVPKHVLAGVILDLYQPREPLPGGNVRYDFSWIDSDVLGTAYEKYLSTVLKPRPKSSQFELFEQKEHEVERVSVRRQSGAYYTPPFMHGYLSTRCIDLYFKDPANAGSIPRVIDFACGSGSFLVAAVDRMLYWLEQHDDTQQWAQRIVEECCVVGVDFDKKAVSIARLRLWHRLVEEPNSLPLPNLSDSVIEGNGLDSLTWGNLDQEYDIVLGNPPFVKTGLIGEKENLSVRFRSATGRFDLSHLFLEQAIRILTPGGYFGLVLPNRVLSSPTARTVRDIVTGDASLLSIVDFGSLRPFRHVSAYIACLIGRRRTEEPSDISKSVTVIEVESLESNFLGALLLDADVSQKSVDGVVSSYLAKQPKTGMWSLLSEQDELLRIALEDATKIGDIAGVYQGIKTGANDLFIVQVSKISGDGLSLVENGLGEEALIESELLRPVLYGAEVRRDERVAVNLRLLYTYRDGRPIPEHTLQERYPQAWEYLHRYKSLLSARATMGNDRWYELVRARSEQWLGAPKLIMRDLARQASFAIDEAGDVCLVGGTAVVPNDTEMLYPLLAYLNSNAVETLNRKVSSQFAGGFQKFEPQHIEKLPVLQGIVDDDEIKNALSELVAALLEATSSQNQTYALELRDEIDKIILQAATDAGIELHP